MADIEKLIGSESRLELGQKINEIVEYKANKNLNNTGMLTNCLLEIPQRIKLELADGVLTLKAGSTVVVPNGANNFEHKSSTSDISRSTFATQSGKNIYIELVVNSSTLVPAGLSWSTNSNTTVGTTAPTSGVFYDTANNIIGNYTSGSRVDVRSFPIALVTMENGVVVSIDQVFNGFGCFGSIVWLDKGVKALIPNRLNEDGTLKNIEVTSTQFSFAQVSAGDTRKLPFFINQNGVIAMRLGVYREQDTMPNDDTYLVWFDTNSNLMKRSSDGGATWQNMTLCHLGYYQQANSSIHTLETKKPFRAVEKYDITNLLSINNGFKTIGSNYVAFYSDETKTNRTLLIQWGVVSNHTANPYTLTFPQAWANKNYSIVATDWEGSGSYAISFDYLNRTVTSCNAHFDVNGGRGFGWFAIGK